VFCGVGDFGGVGNLGKEISVGGGTGPWKIAAKVVVGFAGFRWEAVGRVVVRAVCGLAGSADRVGYILFYRFDLSEPNGT
jgi:hypothetical protein